jgi:2-iminobutanoate/2-iminopropanoate deaminase
LNLPSREGSIAKSFLLLLSVAPLAIHPAALQYPRMRPHIIEPRNSPKPVGPYSHAVRVGDLLFCSGQIPLTKEGNLVPGGVKEQTRQVLENVKAILHDQSLNFENVVKATVFMTNLAEFADMNSIYGEYFTSNFPARSTVQVAALPRGATVEIEVIACYPTP